MAKSETEVARNQPQRKQSCDETVAALDAATPKRGGIKLLLDSFPADTQAAIIRAHTRKVSNREIAKILCAQGLGCSEGAVKNWLTKHG